MSRIWRKLGPTPEAKQNLTVVQLDCPGMTSEERLLVGNVLQQGENTEDAKRLLAQFQRSLEEMIEFREQARRDLERTGR